jgi:hypothetical protein
LGVEEILATSQLISYQVATLYSKSAEVIFIEVYVTKKNLLLMVYLEWLAACEKANFLNLCVWFGLTDFYPSAAES